MISTHILDTSLGCPAKNVNLRLQKNDGKQWIEIAQGLTDSDGRFKFSNEINPGVYQIIFEIEQYFKAHDRESFFMNTPVPFKISDAKKNYHIPLLLNPFGYSTYRGS